jgi:hypothetical protein
MAYTKTPLRNRVLAVHLIAYTENRITLRRLGYAPGVSHYKAWFIRSRLRQALGESLAAHGRGSERAGAARGTKSRPRILVGTDCAGEGARKSVPTGARPPAPVREHQNKSFWCRTMIL